MSAAMESMQRLIAEADARFEEKLRMCVNGQPTNLNVYSDRTYNLRHQIAHNPQLTTDAHFMEMLSTVELALAPEYGAQGEVDKALQSLLAGLLKTLLRECVTQPSYSVRKIMVEMIWHWHQDKQREVLDFSLDRQFPGARFSRPNSAIVPVAQAPARQSDPHGLTEEDWARIDAEQTKKAATKEENHDPTHVAHKLSLFRQRNLAASDKQRKAASAASLASPEDTNSRSQMPTITSPVVGSGVKVVYNKAALEKQRLLQQHLEVHNGPSGPEVLVHHSSLAPFFNKRPNTAFARMTGGERGVALTAQPVDLSIVKADNRIMNHLTRRMEQDQHERERADMLAMLAHNQARMNEESARRIESQAVSAQTGRACHFILTKEADVARFTRSTTGDVNTSFSPYDYNNVDDRIPTLVGELAGNATNRLGLVAPPTLGVANDGLDVVMAADCKITPTDIRLDLPMRQQAFTATSEPTTAPNKTPLSMPYDPKAIPVVTRERLQQLRMVDKVRNAFAEGGAKSSHYPYRAAFKSVVRPTDSTVEECLSLLPLPGDHFPSNPLGAVKEKKKPKSGAKK